MAETRIYGIRHHGPGSARCLLNALERFAPDAVLIEAPADSEDALRLAGHEGLVPPVAMLVYASEEAQRSVFYPQTAFSPEWNAARFALRTGAELRAMDLPVSMRLGAATEGETENERQDPFGWVAQAAGFADGEAWWERLVEERSDLDGVFEAVSHLMGALREEFADSDTVLDKRREAHMRLSLRQAESDGFSRIAVVCGAWHVPAIGATVSAKDDQALLKGLPKAKTSTTWVPYTHERITLASGYGAGVLSPGYYAHLWDTPADLVVHGWLLKTARLLREEGFDASTASVIEAVRLAEALSSVRGRPRPGLRELSDATLSVLTGGRDEPLRTIQRRLIVGLDLGQVPPELPTTPLQADLEATQRRLRLKPEALERRLELDLRNENDLSRSHLLHRLNLLSVPWGEILPVSGKQGTFHEHWRLCWRPEMSVLLLDAARWGSTIEEAAGAMALDVSAKAESLPPLTHIAQLALLAALDEAVPAIMRRLEDSAAAATDTLALLQALPTLGRVMRYGDVRKTGIEAVSHVFSTLFVRAYVGLPAAAASLDDDAAKQLAEGIDGAHSVLALIAGDDREQLWFEALASVADGPATHPLIAGRACRLTLDAGKIDPNQATAALSRAASVGAQAAATASWVEGFVGISGMVLLHHDKLWGVVDEWVCNLNTETFDETLPLLRRTFSSFSQAERRQLGERVGSGGIFASPEDSDLDLERADRVMPLLRLMLGMETLP